jgi:MYXO-CTERM domain-containing protein
MKRSLLGVSFALLALPARPAGAFVRTVTDRLVPVHWARACVGITAHTANPPANLTPDLVLSAAQAAAAAWSYPDVTCTNWTLQVTAQDDADAVVANDQKNNLVFRTSSWGYDPSALAITTVFAQQSDGLIIDADVELNAAGGRFRWGDLVANIGTEGGAEDLQNTLTHEFGHLLGLDHNCYLSGTPVRTADNAGNPVPQCDRASEEVQQATMFAAVTRGDTLRRTLAPDDRAGVCAIYPASPVPDAGPPAISPACTNASVGGGDNGGGGGGKSTGCSFGTGGAEGAGLAVVTLAGLAFSARRRRRRPRG